MVAIDGCLVKVTAVRWRVRVYSGLDFSGNDLIYLCRMRRMFVRFTRWEFSIEKGIDFVKEIERFCKIERILWYARPDNFLSGMCWAE